MNRLMAVFAKILFGGIVLFTCVANADTGYTDPPDSPVARGISASSVTSLDGIESINVANGNLTLSIPVGTLPPGPAGSVGVGLTYNSAIYDSALTSATSVLLPYNEISYITSKRGGGWNYNFHYTLWAQPRFDASTSYFTSGVCNTFTSTEKRAWFRNFLQTPDGASHVLTFVGALTTSGTTATDTFVTDGKNAYVDRDFSGKGSSQCSVGLAPFYGTLIFATTDGSHIRVEANTQFQTWTAFLPNGSRITGPIVSLAGNATDSDADQITDRNNNIISITKNCPAGGSCEEVVQDAYLHQLVLTHGTSNTSTWTDQITWPGANGPVTTLVNWGTFTLPNNLSYYCRVDLSGAILTTYPACNTSTLAFPVVTSVQLPADGVSGNSSNYIFGYPASVSGTVSWGELHYAQLCIGANPSSCQPQWSADYGYKFDTLSTPSTTRPPGTSMNPVVTRVLKYTEVLEGISTTALSEKTTYDVPLPSSAYTYPAVGQSTITHPDGSQTKLYQRTLCGTGFNSRDYCPPVVYRADNPDGSMTEMKWNQQTASSMPNLPTGSILNPYVEYRVQTVGSFSRGSSVAVNRNGNQTAASDYDWVASSAVPRSGGFITGMGCSSSGPCPVRTMAVTYYEEAQNQPYWSNLAPRFLMAPQKTTVVGSDTNVTYPDINLTYDDPLTTANLIQTSQLDPQSGVTLTTQTTYLSNGNGNVSSRTDANGVTSITCYDAAGLYPTAIVVAVMPSAECPNPAAYTEGRKMTFSFNSSSGMLTSRTDADNGVTTAYTYDNLGRPKTVTETAGSLSRSASTSYDDVNLAVSTTAQGLTTLTMYDALGRMRYQRDPAGVQVKKVYRFGNHLSYELTSNAHIATTDQDMGWNMTIRDSGGRPIYVWSYAGAGAPAAPTQPPGYTFAAWGTNTNSSGTQTLSYDLAGVCPTGPGAAAVDEESNTTYTCTDGLGRMTSIKEPNNNVTTYAYDVFDNLIGVKMDGQPNNTCTVLVNAQYALQNRCFNYSQISRLVSTFNPESGLTGFTYYNNGALKTQTQGNVTDGTALTTLTYDKLNRVKTKTFSTTGLVQATPPVTFVYDTDYKGALYSVASSASTTTFGHDAFGRITSSTQSTNGQSYPFTYAYSATDQLAEIHYPSGRFVKYDYDGADRVSAVRNGTTTSPYASINYTPSGGGLTMTLGNNLTEHIDWNDRGQPIQMQAKYPSGANALQLNLYPCASSLTTCPSGNNGNLRSQTVTVGQLNPTPQTYSFTQTYTYDGVNRLKTAAETRTGQNGWTQAYDYDSAGNRWVNQNDNLPALSALTPQGPDWFSSSTVPNRVSGWTYDPLGNLRLPGAVVEKYDYDAESRQVKSEKNGTLTTYAYDGTGQRVSKTTGSQTTIYVYDAFGNVAAEYSTVTPGSPCTTSTCYFTVDHLGSTRLVTDANGVNPVRFDYLPFGEDLYGIDGRTGVEYGSITNPNFTGKNRDSESALFWFEVRSMSGPQGRFQSPDPGLAGAMIGDPQSWNGYSYAGNNPLSNVDPSGQSWTGALIGIANILGQAFGVHVGGPNLGTVVGSIGGGPEFWNERVPISGGGVNTGSVYGGGSAGGTVFSFASPTQIAISDTADFVAGALDSFTFGLSGLFRRQLPGGDPRNYCSSSYIMGEYMEVGAEIAFTAGSSALKQLAKGASRKAVRGAYRAYKKKIGVSAAEGQVLHHRLPLFGHPGNIPTLFPTGGLPVDLHSARMMLVPVAKGAAHNALHQDLRALEGLAAGAVNPAMTGTRTVRNAVGGCN